MAPPTLYAEEKKTRIVITVNDGDGASKMLSFSLMQSERPVYLSQIGYEAVCIDYMQLPVLSLSLVNPSDVSINQQESYFHLTEPTTNLISAASQLFHGSVALSGEDYDFLCDMMDADALSAMHSYSA